MLNDIGSALRWRPVVALALIAGVVAACQGGGGSDVVGGGGLANAHTSITLVAYSVPEPGWSKVIPAFNASEEGKDVQVVTSYAASADQSRGVVEGKPALHNRGCSRGLNPPVSSRDLAM
jgi:sulfate transport system substrate-binding protein